MANEANQPAAGGSNGILSGILSGNIGNAVDEFVAGLPSPGEVADKLGSSLLDRIGTTINKPGSAAAANPDGKLGKVGTVGVQFSLDPMVKWTLVGAVVLLGAWLIVRARKG